MRRVLVVTGPTATGKSALGVELALRLGGEVISADSMQLYRGLDVGTAKITPEETRGVVHHLLDLSGPEERWSVSRWVDAAAAAAEDVLARGRVPVIVGGTNLYIDSLLSGRDFAEAPDAALREALGAEYDRIGGAAFRAKLAEVDPERAAKLADADKKRLVRAMEVWRLTGKTMTAHDAETRALPKRWASLRVALSYADRADLYARIDARVDEMAERGLFDEARWLLSLPLPPDATALQAIGYKEAAACLRGECSRDEALELIRRASRRYAKRQLTWLRRDPGLRWILWQGRPDVPAAADKVARWWAEDE